MIAWPYPRHIAHRGAGTLAPENTLAAMRAGYALGYRMVEFDVKLSGDGVPFLLHDDTLDRTTSGRGRADALTWAELSKLDAGRWHSPAFAGEPLPMLEQVAHWAIANDVACNVEIKPVPGCERATGAAVALDALALWRGSRVQPLLSSFSEEALAAAKGAVPELQKIAKELSLAIVAGVSDRDGSHIYNAQTFIDASGKVVAKYRKTHLVTAAPLDERPYFTAGDAFASYKIDKFNLGLTICYDLRFPEVCRTLAIQHGANVFINSSAWPLPRLEHLRILALARAIENQSYVIVANRVGTDDGVTFCGSSVIVDPYGVIVAAASADREELLQADVSEEIINTVRSRMQVFEHRRHDLY